jgi:hypothetical protein
VTAEPEPITLARGRCPPGNRVFRRHWALPTGRSWQAIAAGYVALFAIVLWPLGPVALGLGIWALRTASRQGSHGRGRAIFGVVVGASTTALLAAVLVSALAG